MEAIRFLPQEEYYKLSPIFRDFNTNLPIVGQIAVAEIDDRIVGFLATDFNPFITMWIDNDYRHSGVWKALVDFCRPTVEPFNVYVIATTSETIAMCEKEGLKKVDYPIYIKPQGEF